MFIFQSLATIFILFVVNRIFSKYKEKRIPKSEIIVWACFWFLVGVAIWWPRLTDRFAQLVGVTRGVDLIVTASIALIFYLLFQIFSHIYKIEREFTKLIRKLAHKELEDKE